MKVTALTITLLSVCSVWSIPANSGAASNTSVSPNNNTPGATPASNTPGATPGNSDSSATPASNTPNSNQGGNAPNANQGSSASNANQSNNTSNTHSNNPPIPYDDLQNLFKQLGGLSQDKFKQMVDKLLEKAKKYALEINTIIQQFNQLPPKQKQIVVLWSGDLAQKLKSLDDQQWDNVHDIFQQETNKLGWALGGQKIEDMKEQYGNLLKSYFSQQTSNESAESQSDVKSSSDDQARPHQYAFFSSLYHSLH